jgi:hypothetical protein
MLPQLTPGLPGLPHNPETISHSRKECQGKSNTERDSRNVEKAFAHWFCSKSGVLL